MDGKGHNEAAYSWRNLSVFIPKNPRALLSIFKSLKYKNFAIYFVGMFFSLIGSWIQQVAMGWLIYNITDSVFILSLSVFLSQIPVLFFTPFAGVVADRFERKYIMMATQSSMMVLSFVLAALTLSGHISIGAILFLSFVGGVIFSFDAPARQSFYSKLVPPRDQTNAIALNSTVINASRFLGPAIGGVMIAAVGEGYCFLLNAFCYLAILLSLYLINVSTVEKHKSNGTLAEIVEGFSYIRHMRPIRMVLSMLAVFSFFGVPFAMLMPAFAKGDLGGGSQTLGNLMSFVGGGALVAALYLAARKSVLGIGRVIVCSCVIFGVALVAISFVREEVLAYAICVPIGFGMVAVSASCNTMLQSLVEESKRGRVMSVFTMVFFGIPPLGSIVQGWVSSYTGLPAVTVFGGIVCVITAFVFESGRKKISMQARKIYAEKGLIMPEMAQALNSVSVGKPRG